MVKKFISKKQKDSKRRTKKKSRARKKEKIDKENNIIQKGNQLNPRHKFEIKSAIDLKDIIAKVILLKNGKYGAINENGDFYIITIDKTNKFKIEELYQTESNLFCQLGNGFFAFSYPNYISFYEIKEGIMNKIGNCESLFNITTYFMEPIKNNVCAISGPDDILELIQFYKSKEPIVTYLNYNKFKKNKKKKIILILVV